MPKEIVACVIRQYSIGNADETDATAKYLLDYFQHGWELAASCMTRPNLIAYTLIKRRE